MSSKYQIFVSSTYRDLKEQRDLIIKAVLEMGHIPVGMEMFSAADEEQWEIIKKQIDQSDYYVVILANRYGSITDQGVSFTEKEYDYAVAKGIPTLGFILERGTPWSTDYVDVNPEHVSSMNLFKDKVQKKHVSYWKNQDDLYGKCSIALMKAFTAYPREGWIRASEYTDKNITGELIRLSSENAKLRKEIEGLKVQEKDDQAREIQNVIRILTKNQRKILVWLNEAENWVEQDEQKALFEIFQILSPEMYVESSIAHLSRYTAHVICRIEPKEFRWDYPVPQNSVKSWLADFSTLGLVRPSTIKKPVSDKDEYWSLTKKGKELLAAIRRVQLEGLLEPDSDSDK